MFGHKELIRELIIQVLESVGFDMRASQPRSRQNEDLIRWLLVTQVHLMEPGDQRQVTALLQKFGTPNYIVKAEVAQPTAPMKRSCVMFKSICCGDN